MLSTKAQILKNRFRRQRPIKRLLIITSLNAKNALAQMVFATNNVFSETGKIKKDVVLWTDQLVIVKFAQEHATGVIMSTQILFSNKEKSQRLSMLQL